jgi:antimicrobial peptide system SdpB family protein
MLEKKINKLANAVIANNTIGIARSFLALSSLFVILFNNLDLILSKGGNRFNFFSVLDFTNYSAKVVSILILLTVIIGWKPRITAILHFWIAFSLFEKMIYPEGGDRIATILTFLLIPILLVDTRKSHWNKKNIEIKEFSFSQKCANIFNYFVFATIRVQVAIIYFFSGISKPFLEDTWKEGTAVYYYLSNSNFGYANWLSVIIEPLLNNPYALLFLTWGAVLLEISLAFCLVASKKYYKFFLILGISLHFSFFIIQGLATFFLVMTGALFMYLGPKEGYNFSAFKWNSFRLFKNK